MATLLISLIIIVLSYILQAFIPSLPWYMPMIIAFVCGLAGGRSANKPFISGFAGVGLFWLILALIIHLQNDGILTSRMAGIMSENMGMNISAILLFIIMVILGGLLGGMASVSGHMLTSSVSQGGVYGRKANRRKGSYKLKLN